MKDGKKTTVRRDKLLRLARTGRLVLVGSYHFDDQHGESGLGKGKELPVRFQGPDLKPWDRQDGVAYFKDSDFEGNSGGAYANENGTVHLRVHSNENYDFRVLTEKEAAEVEKRLKAAAVRLTVTDKQTGRTYTVTAAQLAARVAPQAPSKPVLTLVKGDK